MMPQVQGTITTGKIDLRAYVKAHLLSLRFPNKIRSVLPTWFPLNNSTAWLLGVYVAEGCPHLGKRESSVHFVISDGEILTAKRIKKVCESLGLSVYSNRVKNERALHLRFRSVILARFFKEVLGDSCYNKKIPDFILFNKSLKILRSFLVGYHGGDGSQSLTRGYDYYRFSTSSKVLALQLQLAYGRLGVFVALSHERKESEGMIMGRKVHLHDQYVGGWGDHSNERLHNGSFLLPIKSLSRVKYGGVVYNLSTTDQTYLVSNMTVHNCSVDFRNYFDPKGNWLGGSATPGYSFFIDGIATPAKVTKCPAPQGSCSYPPPKSTTGTGGGI
jgi:LAGLIDADG-like domain